LSLLWQSGKNYAIRVIHQRINPPVNVQMVSPMQRPLIRKFRVSVLVLLSLLFVPGCTPKQLPYFGVGGRYEEGKEHFFRGRGGDMDTAVVALEYVVSRDPTYKKSLTYLGRAYYRKERYQDAYVILQRAVAVDKDDEIAWLALGSTQLRLGQNDKGIETLKGGITLASKVMVEGYHFYDKWDIRGIIRGTIRRCAFNLTKGIEEKENILQCTDRLLTLVDDEENFQRQTRIQNARPLYGK
jgi:tetratricopeptide (TPR) repeat protein